MDISGKKVQWYQKKKKKFGTAGCCLVAKSCLTLVTPWTVAHQSVQGVYQARILEWVARLLHWQVDSSPLSQSHYFPLSCTLQPPSAVCHLMLSCLALSNPGL